jgi:Protein of unknown function (DUF1490)
LMWFNDMKGAFVMVLHGLLAKAWGMRAAREAERKAQQSAEQARLTAADVIAEAKERIGEEIRILAGPSATTPPRSPLPRWAC